MVWWRRVARAGRLLRTRATRSVLGLHASIRRLNVRRRVTCERLERRSVASQATDGDVTEVAHDAAVRRAIVQALPSVRSGWH